MKVNQFNMRSVNGIELPSLPIVRREDPDSLVISSAYTLGYIRACGVFSSADMATVFTSIKAILVDIGDYDVYDEDPVRIQGLAARLGRWHDIVWYPKGNVICANWGANNWDWRRRSGDERVGGACEMSVLNFIESIPEMVALWSVKTKVREAELNVAEAISGKSIKEVINDPAIIAIMEISDSQRKLADLESGENISDLILRFEARDDHVKTPHL